MFIGYGYVEFEQPEDADKAMKHMDGGQIDGQEVTCELTHPPRTTVNSGGRRPISPLRYVLVSLYPSLTANLN